MKTTSKVKMTKKKKTSSNIVPPPQILCYEVFPVVNCSCTHKHKIRRFHTKTSSAKLYIYIGVGARGLYIDEAHMALDIFRFAVFFYVVFILDFNKSGR